MKRFRNKLSHVRLSQQERYSMRSELQEFMRYYPATTTENATIVPSPWFSLFSTYPVLKLVPIALFFLFFGTGIALAAERALPGDLLYPVKLSVNEGLRKSLATTPVAKAKLETELIDRRLVEAETLFAQGRLTKSTETSIATEFATHKSAVRAKVSEMKKKGDASDAELVAERLETTIAAHGVVMTEMDVNKLSIAGKPREPEASAQKRNSRQEQAELLAVIAEHVKRAEEEVIADRDNKMPVALGLALQPTTLGSTTEKAHIDGEDEAVEDEELLFETRANEEKEKLISKTKKKIERETKFRFENPMDSTTQTSEEISAPKRDKSKGKNND